MFETYRNAIRLFSRDAWLLVTTTALTRFSFMGIYVTLFNLYLLRLGYTLDFIGLINAVAQLGFAFFSLPAGTLGKRWGSRSMTITGQAVAVVSFGLLPLAEFVPEAWQASWLMITYVVAWLGGGLYLVNNYPFLMSVTGPAERNHVFSVRQALVPLGSFAGSLTGGILPGLLATALGLSLDQPAPYRYALFVAAGALVFGVVALSATRDVKVEHSQRQTQTATPTPVGLITFMALVTLLLMAGNSAAGIFLNVYLDAGLQLPIAWIGVLVAVGELLAVPAALVTPSAVARWGKRGTIIMGTYGLAVSLLPLAFISHWGAAGLSFIGISAAFAFTSPALMVCQQEIVPPEWRTAMSGAVVMARGLGTAAMAFGGSHLISAFGYHNLFLAGAAFVTLGATLFWSYTWAPRWIITHRTVVSTN